MAESRAPITALSSDRRRIISNNSRRGKPGSRGGNERPGRRKDPPKCFEGRSGTSMRLIIGKAEPLTVSLISLVFVAYESEELLAIGESKSCASIVTHPCQPTCLVAHSKIQWRRSLFHIHGAGLRLTIPNLASRSPPSAVRRSCSPIWFQITQPTSSLAPGASASIASNRFRRVFWRWRRERS